MESNSYFVSYPVIAETNNYRSRFTGQEKSATTMQNSKTSAIPQDKQSFEK